MANPIQGPWGTGARQAVKKFFDELTVDPYAPIPQDLSLADYLLAKLAADGFMVEPIAIRESDQPADETFACVICECLHN